MKKGVTALFLIAAMSLLALIALGKYSHASVKPSRFGLKGKMVYVVTQVAPFIQSSEIKAGDVITSLLIEGQDNQASSTTGQYGPLTSIETLQNSLTSSRPGAPVSVEFLRPNDVTRNLDHHAMTLQTVAHPASQSRATLGLVGAFGFMVEEIEPSTNQPELNVGDILLSTDLSGEITDVDQFRTTVKKSPAGAAVKTDVLRFNSALGKFENKSVTLTLYPYPDPPQSQSQTVMKGDAAAI